MVKKKTKKKYYNQKSFIKGAVRRLFSRSPVVIEVLSGAIHPTIKGVRGGKQFICVNCKKTFAQKDVQVHHRESVVPLNKTLDDLDYNTIVKRIFCTKKNLKVLCISCHKKETIKERVERKKLKKKK